MQQLSTNATGLSRQALVSSTTLRQKILLVLIALQTACWIPFANAQERDPRRGRPGEGRERPSDREPPPNRRPPERDRSPDRERPNPPNRERRPDRERPEPRPRPEPPRPDPRPRPEPPRPGPGRDRDDHDRRERERRERDRWEREERARRERQERDRWEREERARRERQERDRWEREERARREREERDRWEREERARRERERRDREGQVLAVQTYMFRYNKPHDQMMWSVLDSVNGAVLADQLVISSTGTDGLKGANGIAGISQAVVYYTDGTMVDLVAQSVRRGDLHVRKGLLRLSSELDEIVIPLDGGRIVQAVYIKADSWISATVPVELMFSLERAPVLALP